MEANAKTGISDLPDDRGTEVDKVSVMIDYAIVTHFSDHLYGSPNKAVEELVANSYDAWATKSRIYLPGEYSHSALLVWDDGESMDIQGIHSLWWIAKSPKLDDTSRIQERPSRRSRALIGKFGIGKLASYSLGFRVTHLCKKDGNFFRITVDYRNVPSISEGDRTISFQTPIIQLSEDDARQYVESLFATLPDSFDETWRNPSWTVAIVDELKPDRTIHAGRLRWIMGNGMPLRPDFNVFVDDIEVQPSLQSGAFGQWDLSVSRLQEQLLSDWNEATGQGRVSGDLSFEYDKETEINIVRLPHLGDVSATVKLFNKSLLGGRSSHLDRSHGFFVMVRGRLLNPEDDKLLLHEPSFGTFYRSQFQINADGLDSELLADRERVQTDSPAARELEVVQHALYLFARQELHTQDEREELTQRSESLLPIQSRDHFTDPMTALLMSRDKDVNLQLASARIVRGPLPAGDPLVVLGDEGFTVNINHPLFQILSDRLGDGSVAREALRAFDVLATTDLLLAGHLFDIGMDQEQIDEILAWRDGLLRSIATRLTNAQDDLVREARESSYKGNAPFEVALANLFTAMGFKATRDGLSGKKDVIVVAPIGEKAHKFIIEAKGSKGPLSNSDADISVAAAHMIAAGAEFAVVVGREFAGFEKVGERAMVLQECDGTKGQVSIASLDVCIAIFEAVNRFSYPLDIVLPLLKIIESPADKLARVERLMHPTVGYDYVGVLNEIWEQQQDPAFGDVVSFRPIWQGRKEWKELEFAEFKQRLLALQVLADGLIRVSNRNETVTLRQSPEVIVAAIKRALRLTDSAIVD